MSIVALSYHVFHAKTSRHVSYLRKGKNVPRLDALPVTKYNVCAGARAAACAGACFLQIRNWKIVKVAPFGARQNMVSSNQKQDARKRFRRYSRRARATIMRVSKSDRLRPGCSSTGPAQTGGMPQSGKEERKCPNKFRGCGTRPPPCWWSSLSFWRCFWWGSGSSGSGRCAS